MLLGPGSLASAHVLHKLAFSLVRQGREEEAEPVSRQANGILDAKDPSDLRSKADMTFILGWSLAGQGRTEEAVALFDESLRLREESGGSENPAMGWTLNLKGRTLIQTGDETQVREGIRTLERALRDQREDLRRPPRRDRLQQGQHRARVPGAGRVRDRRALCVRGHRDGVAVPRRCRIPGRH